MLKQEMMKNGKIVDEMITFLLFNNHYKLNVDIDFSEKQTIFTIQTAEITANEIEHIEECLSNKRDESLEMYSWELLGESCDGSELQLVGVCIDTYELEVNETGGLILKLFRKH